MTITPLFLDDQAKLTFEKSAMAIKLSDNVDNWQKEISSEIFKYLPFLSEYAVNVLIQRVNPERGYAFGSAQVTPPSENPAPAGPAAVIPLIVTDRVLKPLDVFFHEDEAYPLTESRLRDAISDNRTFETSNRKPPDQGMVDQMYPPIRSNYGAGSGMTTGEAASGGGFGKFASSSLCEAIAPTVSKKQADLLLHKIASDEQLGTALKTNKAFEKVAADLICAERTDLKKTASVLVESIHPTVVQFTKLADGNFRIKWANVDAYAPQEQDVSPQDAESMAGSDALQNMQPGDSATLGTEEAAEPKTVSDGQVTEPGVYEVTVEEDGQRAAGHVLPVMDFDGALMPLYLFTDGERYSLQDDIAGTPVGEGVEDIPAADAPQGDGAFVFETENGMVATPPVTVQNQVTDPEGATGYLVQTAFGDTINLVHVPGLLELEQLDEESYSLPDSAVFTPLGEAIHLVKTEEEAEQVKEARLAPQRGYLRSTGPDEFHLDGMPFAKLASDKRQWLDKTAAEFVLVTAGANPLELKSKFANARAHGISSFDGLRSITPLDQVHRETVKEAQKALSEFPYHLRQDTVKLASVLEDSETADKILAMNFLSPENISIFADYLPHLDETAKKLAEMLVAARMGMKPVDEGALERAMKSLEQVIEGLKAIQQQQLL